MIIMRDSWIWVYSPLKTVITLENVHKHYSMGDNLVKALNGVSLSIEESELAAIIGSSGSGKSTLMHIIGCLDRPTSGQVLLEGRDISFMNDEQLSGIRNRNIGFVFQQFNLLPRLSILDNVAIPLFYAGVKALERFERAMAELEKVGLGDRVKHRPTELSGGQKQRASIARALVSNPGIILADEPTGALDTKTGEMIMDLFKKINIDGRTVIIVTHDPEVSAQCNRVIRLRDGMREETINAY